jgi:hypothetical protein
MFKKIFCALVIGHSAVALYIASNSLHQLKITSNFSIFTTFFRQSWSFFGPYPVLSNTVGEYKCIYTDRLMEWKSIADDLERSKRPYSDIFFSNNPEYLLEFLIENAVYSVPEEAYQICGLGDCSGVRNIIESNYSYKKMQIIAKDLCVRKSQQGPKQALLGSKIRLIIRNVPFYSERKIKKDNYIDDVLELPYFEI